MHLGIRDHNQWHLLNNNIISAKVATWLQHNLVYCAVKFFMGWYTSLHSTQGVAAGVTSCYCMCQCTIARVTAYQCMVKKVLVQGLHHCKSKYSDLSQGNLYPPIPLQTLLRGRGIPRVWKSLPLPLPPSYPWQYPQGLAYPCQSLEGRAFVRASASISSVGQ